MTAQVVSISSGRERPALPTESKRGRIDIPVGDLSLTELKSLVESAVIDAVLRAQNSELSVADSPFDAVYIADLRPDKLSFGALSDIIAAAKTNDLSMTLALDDLDE